MYCERQKFGGTLVWQIWLIKEIRQLVIYYWLYSKFAKLSSANLLRKEIRQTKVPPGFRLLRYVCLSFRAHVRKPSTGKSSPYTRNKG